MSFDTVLVDGDIVAYRAAAVAQTNVNWGDGTFSSYADERKARSMVDRIMSQIREETGVARGAGLRVVLSDMERRWRSLVMATYKDDRTAPKPVVLLPIRAYLQEVYGALIEPWLEGDDMLGLLSTRPGKEIRCIWSPDKDLSTVPGTRFPGGGKDPIVTDAEGADLNHLVQALAGDRVDGYFGCPKVGPVKARRLLESHPPAGRWGAVVRAYEKAGLTEEVALQNARVARVLRHGERSLPSVGTAVGFEDMSFEELTGVKLWSPA